MKVPTLHFADEALLPQPPINFVVENFITEGSLTIVAGDAGMGKTYLLLDLGACVAKGEPWAGTQRTQKGTVLFVDEESGLTRFNIRLKKVMLGHGLGKGLPFYYSSLGGFNFFSDKDALPTLENIITMSGATLVIIDAFVDVTAGADENAVKDITPVMQGFRMIAEKTKAALVVIHHNNKNGTYRGSTVLKGLVDLLVNISKDQNLCTIKSEKSRDTEPFEFTVKMNFGIDDFIVTNPCMTLGGVQKFIIEYLANNGPSSSSDIKANTTGKKISANSISTEITDLQKKGYIVNTNNSIGIAGIYDLTQTGLEWAANQSIINDPYKAATFVTMPSYSNCTVNQ